MSVSELLARRKTKENYSFEQWLGFLDQVYLTWRWKARVAQQTGQECWRDYYDDGYTPEEAAREDLSCA